MIVHVVTRVELVTQTLVRRGVLVVIFAAVWEDLVRGTCQFLLYIGLDARLSRILTAGATSTFVIRVVDQLSVGVGWLLAQAGPHGRRRMIQLVRWARLEKVPLIVATLEDLGRVECLILPHLLLHDVLHDPPIECLASFLIRQVHLFRVIQEWSTLVLATTLA